VREIKSVLDVGGDRGQYLSEFTSAEKFVLEMSEHPLERDVSRIDEIGASDYFDLIIYAHVAEHVANPIFEIRRLIKHSSMVYVEVPNGLPKTSIIRRSYLLNVFYRLLSLNPILWKFFAAPAAGRRPVGNILRQSEHINFFTKESFEYISDLCNVTVTIQKTIMPTPDGSTFEVLQVLLTKN